MKNKKHILEDGKWHKYHWVFNGKKSILYIDGKVFEKKMPMTTEYYLKANKRKKKIFNMAISGIDELRISKCARRIK